MRLLEKELCLSSGVVVICMSEVCLGRERSSSKEGTQDSVLSGTIDHVIVSDTVITEL